jgi:hypothetical protein
MLAGAGGQPQNVDEQPLIELHALPSMQRQP